MGVFPAKRQSKMCVMSDISPTADRCSLSWVGLQVVSSRRTGRSGGMMNNRWEATARRSHAPSRRNRLLGPLRFNDEEWVAISAAAGNERLVPGAWAAARLVGVARQELVVAPVDDRGLVLELARTRADLAELGRALVALSARQHSRESTDLLAKVEHAIHRVQRAADAVAEDVFARRYRGT